MRSHIEFEGETALLRPRSVCVETIYKASEHGYDPTEHFFARLNSAWRDKALRDCRVQAGGTFDCGASRIIEKFRSLASPAFSVSLCSVQQGRKACPIQLVKQFAAMCCS